MEAGSVESSPNKIERGWSISYILPPDSHRSVITTQRSKSVVGFVPSSTRQKPHRVARRWSECVTIEDLHKCSSSLRAVPNLKDKLAGRSYYNLETRKVPTSASNLAVLKGHEHARPVGRGSRQLEVPPMAGRNRWLDADSDCDLTPLGTLGTCGYSTSGTSDSPQMLISEQVTAYGNLRDLNSNDMSLLRGAKKSPTIEDLKEELEECENMPKENLESETDLSQDQCIITFADATQIEQFSMSKSEFEMMRKECLSMSRVKPVKRAEKRCDVSGSFSI
eukprot:Platyproteum_vivax@DN27_c0_g1_i1.p1